DAELALGVQRSASLGGLGHIFPAESFPFPDDAVRMRWDERLAARENRILVAEERGVPVGIVATRSGSLEGFFVLPERWGTGIASRLHDEALASLRNDGFDAAELWVLEANHRARRFYDRHNWQLDGRGRGCPYPPYPPEVGYTIELV